MKSMPKVAITQEDFLQDRQGRTFADVVNDPKQPFEQVLAFFSDAGRQQRMEDAEIHHGRAPLAGLVRELEALSSINDYFCGVHAQETQRLRQAIGVLVRIIMERRGWKKAGRKGSLGVRAESSPQMPAHNSGGLSLWFVRAERYQLEESMPYQSVTQRSKELEATIANQSSTET
jgi:hypothetical protein